VCVRLQAPKRGHECAYIEPGWVVALCPKHARTGRTGPLMRDS
jgi:hypothetical protein